LREEVEKYLLLGRGEVWRGAEPPLQLKRLRLFIIEKVGAAMRKIQPSIFLQTFPLIIAPAKSQYLDD
jgi:hypothetical protein